MAILTMVLPLIVNVLSNLADRIFLHWKTSGAGVVGGVASYQAVSYVLQQYGCDLSHVDIAAGTAAAIPFIMGLFGVDKSRVVSLSQKAVDGGTISTVSVGEQTDKNGNPILRSWIPLLALCFFAASCSPKGEEVVKKVEADVVRIEGHAVDAVRVLCKDLPLAAQGISIAKPLVADSQVQAGLQTAATAIDAAGVVCAAVGVK